MYRLKKYMNIEMKYKQSRIYVLLSLGHIESMFICDKVTGDSELLKIPWTFLYIPVFHVYWYIN
jgi:hypothetical protein